jgi:hypothetical protein
MTIYARINRHTESSYSGIETRAMECLLYDNPELSSPLVEKHPILALNFPMRIIAWEDQGCHVAFSDPFVLLKAYDPALIEFHWPDLRTGIQLALAK